MIKTGTLTSPSRPQSRHNPDIVVSVLLELFRRDAIKRVLSGRNEETLQPILTFLVNHVTNPRHCSVLCDLAHILTGEFVSGVVDKFGFCLNFLPHQVVIN